ncbi:MFS transporter [Actinomycetota bacterium]
MNQTPVLEGPPTRLSAIRDFRLLLMSSTCSWLGNAMVPVGVAFAVLEHHAPARDVALVLMAEAAAMVALVLVGGVVADRAPRRIVFLAATLLRIVAGAATAWLLLTQQYRTWPFALMMLAYGAGAAFAQPAGSGLLNEIVTDSRQRHQAAGTLMMANGITWVAGPALAAAVMARGGSGWVFLADVILLTFTATAVIVMNHPHAKPTPGAGGVFEDLRVGWQEFTSRRWLWMTICSVSVMFAAVIAPLNSLGPVVSDTAFDGAGDWAVILVGLSAGRVAGGVLATVWLPQRPLLVGSSLVMLMTPAMLALALPMTLWLVTALQFLGGVGCGYFLSMWSGLLQNWVDPERIARVVAFDWFGTLVGMPLGYVLVAAALPIVGTSGVLVTAAVAAVAAVLPLVLVPEVRNVAPAPPALQTARS